MPLRTLGLTALLLATMAACGAGADSAGADSAVQDGGGALACTFAPSPGTFTFHIRNDTADKFDLFFNCGSGLPISLNTSAGRIDIAPTSNYECDQTCEEAAAGMWGACIDCGAGIWRSVQPGETTDLVWDRRSYVLSTTPVGCLPHASSCYRGTPVAPTSTQTGTLAVCSGHFIYCEGGRTVAFTADTTKNEATIDVR